MIISTLALVQFFYSVPLQCKLILSTNASKPVQNEGSHAEILNSSLELFDNFTLCARYYHCHKIYRIQYCNVRFLTFNFSVSSEICHQPNQYLFTYKQMSLLGNLHSTFSHNKGAIKNPFYHKSCPLLVGCLRDKQEATKPGPVMRCTEAAQTFTRKDSALPGSTGLSWGSRIC